MKPRRPKLSIAEAKRRALQARAPMSYRETEHDRLQRLIAIEVARQLRGLRLRAV